MHDVDVINDYYFQLCKFWRVPDSIIPDSKLKRFHFVLAPYSFNIFIPFKLELVETKKFRESLHSNVNVLKSNHEEREFLQLPPLSVYHFQSAINFTKSRLDKLNRDYSGMNQNFSSKSLNYLQDSRFVCNYWNWSDPSSQNIEHSYSKWPHSFKLLLEISCFILDCSFNHIQVVMKKIEEKVFPQHSSRYRNRKWKSSMF